MLQDSIQLLNTSEIVNAKIESGTAFPINPDQGRMFFLTASITDYDAGIYVYNGTVWEGGDIAGVIAGFGLTGGGTIGTINLAVDTNTIATNLSVTTAVGGEATARSVSEGLLSTAINNEVNARIDADGVLTTAVGNHIVDATAHLTPTQNTWLDSLTATATEVNYLVGVTSAIQTQLNTKAELSGSSMTGSLVMPAGTHITLADSPVTGTDAVNKNYVDANLAGLSWKPSVTVATTGNIVLTGVQTIDGILLVADNRVLVKNQTITAENGIYVASAVGWSRASDMDQTTPINEVNSAAMFVEKGTTQADTGWTQINNVVTLGTDAVAFTQFNGAAGITAGVGMTKTGNVLDVNLGAGIAQLPTDEIGVDVYVGGGLITTTNGSASSTVTGAQLALAPVGTAGTYKSVTTNSYGQITAGTNPTTLAGYGITDAVSVPVWSIKTTAYTAVNNDNIFANTAGGAFTITLPAAPAMGATVTIADLAGTFATYNLTIGRNAQPIMGLAEDMVVSTSNSSFKLVYSNTTYGWRLV